MSMLETFRVAFRLRITYRVNGFIYLLKSLPLLKKLLPVSLYASPGLKKLAFVVSALIELVNALLGKFLYLLALYMTTQYFSPPAGHSFLHMLFFLTWIGGIFNTKIFDPSRDKFYAMFCLRMEARLYTLTDYSYFLLKMLLGFLVFSLLWGMTVGLDVLTCLSIPLLVLEVKLFCTAWSLRDFLTSGRQRNENRMTPLLWVIAGLLLGAALLPPWLGYALPPVAFPVAGLALLLPGAWAARYIWRFDSYRAIYKELLKPENYVAGAGTSVAAAAQQLAMQKKISADLSQTSNKSGYQYFNELFMKRHSRLLTRSARRLALICAAFFAVAAAGCLLIIELRPLINGALLTYLPYFLFIMYLLNRGQVITRAMFMNCDHSMLTYRFYRQPKAILTLFVARLKYVVLINLLPAAVIALGLPLLLLISGGTEQPLNYLLLFVSIIAMSIFFSVHHMVLYYLLQPYNVALEAKSAFYSAANSLTYVACYAAAVQEISTLSFGAVISAFCILYALAAFLLAYRLAPKTFKLRL